MIPAPGERLQRFVGDSIRFLLKTKADGAHKGWRALLRTNLGRAELLRHEIIQAHTRGMPPAGASWRDLPMQPSGEDWSLDVPLTEVGYFKAKAYLIDPRGWQHWPSGPDVGIAVHPDRYRTGNTIYCAFPRLFGQTFTALSTVDGPVSSSLKPLDEAGFTVIPPSGKLRDLTRQLPHIIGKLGCRILHLLPIHPTPTTGPRMGRFGSPYAALDLTAIDPALVDFDRRTTGLDQFRELAYETHHLGGRLFLDLVLNHTGWGAVLQENHPQWCLRGPDGAFASPGAWGVTWEDLVELKHQNVALWDELSEVLLTWCRRGVDGFRCDAAYKVPVAAWQYIVAQVQQEFPETLFLVEGLGGAWEATDALLAEGTMHWAYSELFQNYSGAHVAGYLDHSLKQSERAGLLVHYSETHDNPRLATRGPVWALLRNRLSALASVSGGFGFTCGVEWLAQEKIDVHGCTGLAWDNPENLVPELAALNRLLANHPCFFDGAKLARLSPVNSPTYALRRESQDCGDVVLVLVNTDVESVNTLALDESLVRGPDSKVHGPVSAWVDLLGQTTPRAERNREKQLVFELAPGAAFCLAPAQVPQGLHGDAYRQERMRAAWGLRALSRLVPAEALGRFEWRVLAAEVDRAPARFLAAVSHLASEARERGAIPSESTTGAPESASVIPLHEQLLSLLRAAPAGVFPRVVEWSLMDARRITPVPPGHWLLIQDTDPFRASLVSPNTRGAEQEESVPANGGHIACFAPRRISVDATLSLERYASKDHHLEASIRFLAPDLLFQPPEVRPSDLVLLTNGRGGMARLCLEPGRVNSKYDCVLGANLHPALPVDRHVLAKRIRLWANADGFISALDSQNLASFEPGPPAVWHFVANAGDGRTVEIHMTAAMLEGRNTTVFRFSRPSASKATGKQLPASADVRLTVRLDIEDRNFHWETKRNSGAEHHFSSHTRTLATESPGKRATGHSRRGDASPDARVGFVFTPARDRQLRVFCDSGFYHPQPEWSENIPHPVEQTRGQTGSGDAFSPGWFEIPLPKGAETRLVVTAEPSEPGEPELITLEKSSPPVRGPQDDEFDCQLTLAAHAFLVQRDRGKTVIAGYPWFLDWGRDTFICARGLVAAGKLDEVKQVLLTFARFEKDGTLPNTIYGEDASNRDTSDAPLWFGVVCEELAAATAPRRVTSETPHPVYSTAVDKSGRTLLAVLRSIALNYIKGTPNSIRIDPASALIWSPSHFTWMDTNYPACTPRQGYPVEIQALWIRLLQQLARVDSQEAKRWAELAGQALDSLKHLFWREDLGYCADVLLADAGQPAAAATVDTALRSNCLVPVSLGLIEGEKAKRCVEAARRHLVVPGALRSLAPLPVSVPLPNHAGDGRLLNDPLAPYWGRYEGDEDTRRKPAYHNGTAWTWTFPVFCEALARAWQFAPPALDAAKAYLGSVGGLMAEGCLGQIPEIVDGDAPHTQRGCDAQAWSATEALRVWKLLREKADEKKPVE